MRYFLNSKTAKLPSLPRRRLTAGLKLEVLPLNAAAGGADARRRSLLPRIELSQAAQKLALNMDEGSTADLTGGEFSFLK